VTSKSLFLYSMAYILVSVKKWGSHLPCTYIE